MRALSFLALVLLFTGCDSTESFDASARVGTYSGSQIITDPDGSVNSEDVTVSVRADDVAGTITIRVDGDDLDGTYDADGATFTVSDALSNYSFTVAPDGDIDGDGTFSFLGVAGDLDISGEWTADRFDLVLLLTYTATNPDSGISVGDVSRSETRATRD